LYGVGNQELQVFLSYESNSVRMIKRKKIIWVVGGCTSEGKHKKRKVVIGKSARIISSWKFNIEICPGEGGNEDVDLVFLSYNSIQLLVVVNRVMKGWVP